MAVAERGDVRPRKTAVPVAQQEVGEALVVVGVVVGARGHAEIEPSVAVEVTDGHGLGVLTYAVCRIAEEDAEWHLESALAIAQQDGHVIGIGGGQVAVAVIIEVADRERERDIARAEVYSRLK